MRNTVNPNMRLFKHCAHYLLYDDVNVYADQRLKLLNNWMHFLNEESNVTSCTWSDVCVQLHRNRSGRDMIVKNQSKAPRNRRSLRNRYTLNHCFFGSKLGFSHILDLPSSSHRAHILLYRFPSVKFHKIWTQHVDRCRDKSFRNTIA